MGIETMSPWAIFHGTQMERNNLNSAHRRVTSFESCGNTEHAPYETHTLPNANAEGAR